MSDPILIQADPPQTEPGDGALLQVPSGQELRLLDVIWNVPGPLGLASRFRFVAPAIARGAQNGGVGVDFALAAADMEHLCQNFALPRVLAEAAPPGQIIISLSDRPVPFGEADPEATQFFEAYRVEDGTCIWEAF